jgi:intracellular multiplication protein IcmL
MADQDGLVLVFARNTFYQRLHYLALVVFAMCLIVIVILISTLYVLMQNPAHPLYFAADEVGRLIKIIPVNKPNMADEDVVSWTVDAVQASYSYDYINYRVQLEEAQKYFTNYGWSKYFSALVASNNLLAIIQRKMIGLAQVVGPPKLLQKGLLGGAVAWKFQIPVLVTYALPPYDDKSSFLNPLVVTVIVQRQPPLEGYKGLGVVQMIGALQAEAGGQPQEISGTQTGS